MNVNKPSGIREASTVSSVMLKSTTEIAKLISNEYLKELELKEYCQIVESDFTKCQKKFQDLMERKNESAAIKAEYKSRNKINTTNSESLLKALNELHKYKCELKSNYVSTEKELKLKRFKYKKIISSYESAWDETLKKYNKTSFTAELHKIQEENEFLEKELETLVKLMTSTKTQFTQLKDNIEQNFYKRVVEFSKLMNQYKKFMTSQNQNEKKQSLKPQTTSKILDFSLFRTKPSLLMRKSSSGNENGDDENVLNSIDMKIFDDLVVPSENLECQNLEEDGYSFLHNEMQRIYDVSKDKVEAIVGLNNPQETAQPKKRKLLRDLKDNSMQDDPKSSVVEENESHYFRQQSMEYFKQSQTGNQQEVKRRSEENINQGNTKEKFLIEGAAEKLKSVNNSAGSVLQQTESEDEIKDNQMECEEFLSEGSYEKQYSIHKEIYDRQKTSSISSEGSPPPKENLQDNDGPIQKPSEDKRNKNVKPQCEVETNNLKSFAGFFTMGNDNENPTPSIFKLF